MLPQHQGTTDAILKGATERITITPSLKQGTSTVDFLKEQGMTPKLKELKKFPNISDAFMELIAGGCDAVFFDSPNHPRLRDFLGKVLEN